MNGANRLPCSAAIGSKSGAVGSAITFTATATDPDAGQTRTFSLDAGAPAGATINSSTGAFSWTPAAAGTFTVTVVVADNGTPQLSDSETVTITVTAANQAPVLGAIGGKSGAPGSAITFTATATDPNAGQTRTFSLTGAPAGATINSSTGAFSWTPAAAGTFSVTVVVADNGTPQLSDSETVTITVTAANQAPVLGAIGGKSGAPGSAITFTATATDPNAGQTRTFSLTGAPAGATINSSTGAFSWTPAAAGTFSVTVVVADNGTPQLSDSETVTITVTAATLTITTASLPAGTVNTAYNQALAAAGGTTPYSWSVSSGTLPAGLTLSSAGALSGTPTAAGTFNFTVQATGGGTATKDFSLTVNEAAPAGAVTITPADSATDVPTNTVVTARIGSGDIRTIFNRDTFTLRPSTAIAVGSDDESEDRYGALASTECVRDGIVRGAISYNDSHTRARFTPNCSLKNNLTYIGEIAPGGESLSAAPRLSGSRRPSRAPTPTTTGATT